MGQLCEQGLDGKYAAMALSPKLFMGTVGLLQGRRTIDRPVGMTLAWNLKNNQALGREDGSSDVLGLGLENSSSEDMKESPYDWKIKWIKCFKALKAVERDIYSGQ